MVAPDLPGIMKEYTKFIIRNNPEDLLEASAEYFREKAGIVKGEANTNNISEEDMENMRSLFAKYDSNGNGIMDAAELGQFIMDDLGYEISDDELAKVRPHIPHSIRRTLSTPTLTPRPVCRLSSLWTRTAMANSNSTKSCAGGLTRSVLNCQHHHNSSGGEPQNRTPLNIINPYYLSNNRRAL